MKVLRGDAGLRFASLALAAGLWFVVAGRQTAERGISVPVELRNVPRDLELTGDPVDSVDVRLRASPGLIETLDPGRVTATVDLSGAEEGERIVPLTPGQIRLPFGFRVVRITPARLTLHLERTQRAAVPVRPRIVGRPAAGFELAEVTSEPAEVHVVGPRSHVQQLESAHTEPVSVEGASSTVQAWVTVGMHDPSIRLEGGSRVQVTARVREASEVRVFEGLEIATVGRAAQVEPARARVVLSGPASQVRALEPGALRLYVTLPGEGPLPERVPVSVELGSGRPGVAVVETRPAEVTVRLQPPRLRPAP